MAGAAGTTPADQSGARVGGKAEHDSAATYDVQLARRPPEELRRQFPSMTIRTTGAQTVLLERVTEPQQLDELLDKVFAMGLVLLDLHRRPPSSRGCRCDGGDATGRAIYEVRVAGELGEALLRYLRWVHYAVPTQTLVRLTAASADLHRFLVACTDSGARIERVRRVGAT